MPDNTPISRRTFVGTVAAAVGGLAVARPGYAAATPTAENEATPAMPQTIPALREWTPLPGAYQLDRTPQIVIRPKHARQLADAANILTTDLRTIACNVRVAVTDRPAHTGDIVIELGSTDAAIGSEGYVLTVGPYISITARTASGAFYATRTLLQFLRQNTSITAGVARDWPRYAERGLMVDIARMHFTYDWLADRIRDMAYLKLNLLHLHFTDSEGWRIESRTGVQSEQFLTKHQIRSLVALAAQHHVTVVPEIDMPAHLGALLTRYPQYQLKDTSGVALPDKIDYSIPEARALLHSLVAEYLPLFPGPYWHMGTDEYLSAAEYANYPQLERYAQQRYGPQAVAKDGVLGLINEINADVRANGKTLRVWNDIFGPGGTVQVDRNVVVEWWTDLNFPYPSPTNPKAPQDVLNDGYSILNASFFPTYDYPLGPPAKPSVQWMYENWKINTFHGPAYFDEQGTGFPFLQVDPAEPRNRGSLIHLWNSGGTWTEAEAAASIYPRLRVMAQKTWESPPLVTTYAEFEPIIESVGTAP